MRFQEHQDRDPDPASTTPEQPVRPADDHAAAFPTRLAMARWTRGGDVPHVFATHRAAPLRAAWYAQAQRHFQSWLEDGGFHAE